jgi:hypothetical protein
MTHGLTFCFRNADSVASAVAHSELPLNQINFFDGVADLSPFLGDFRWYYLCNFQKKASGI